jgi:hypothetical protein
MNIAVNAGEGWTREQEIWLTDAAQADMSYSELRNAFNQAFRANRTRNAILGKCSRMGLRGLRPKRNAPKPYKQSTTRAGRLEQAAANRVAKQRGKPAPQPTAVSDAPAIAPNLPNRRSPQLSGESFSAKRRLTPEQLAVRMAPKPVLDISEDATAKAKPLLDCRSDECRWPISATMACGKKVERRSYCAHHLNLAYPRARV